MRIVNKTKKLNILERVFGRFSRFYVGYYERANMRWLPSALSVHLSKQTLSGNTVVCTYTYLNSIFEPPPLRCTPWRIHWRNGAPSSTVYFNEFFKGYTVEEGAPFPLKNSLKKWSPLLYGVPLEEFIEEMEPPPLRCTPWRIHWRNGAPPPMGLYWNLYGTSECSN